jgi:hypothetical protein
MRYKQDEIEVMAELEFDFWVADKFLLLEAINEGKLNEYKDRWVDIIQRQWRGLNTMERQHFRNMAMDKLDRLRDAL